MADKKFVKTGDNEAIDLSRVIKWERLENRIILTFEGGQIEIRNPAYIEHINAMLLSQTDTLIGRKRH
ncbi:MAG: hypothetical protein MI748_10305 [Opitutales bacterium]|nr:hypothetical protein [Opitutales bacterium]